MGDAPRKPDEQGRYLRLAWNDREEVTWRYRDSKKLGLEEYDPLKTCIQIQIYGFFRLICPITALPFGRFSASLDAELFPNLNHKISESPSRLSPFIQQTYKGLFYLSTYPSRVSTTFDISLYI